MGCGPGRLAIGLLLEFGELARYVGVDHRRQHIEWCTHSLGAGREVEFLLHDTPDGNGNTHGPASFTPARDERFDVISASFGPETHPSHLANLLNWFRDHSSDGKILLRAAEVPDEPVGRSRIVEVVEVVEQAGLTVEQVTSDADDQQTFLVLSAGGGRERFSREWLQNLCRAEFVARRVDGLEHRCRVLDEERTALIRRLDARQAEHAAVVEELRERLKRSKRDVRARDRRIANLQKELREAERTLGRRSVRAAVTASNLVLRPSVRRGTDGGRVSSRLDRDDRRRSGRTPTSPESGLDAGASPADDATGIGGISESAPARSASHATAPAVAPCDLVVFTALVGHYDELPAVAQFEDSEVRFVCFSDIERADARGWEIEPIEYYSNDPKRTALFVKTHPHLYFPDREWSLWIDASVSLAREPIGIIDDIDVADSELAAFLHPDRASISDQADRSVRLGLDLGDIVEDQMRRYVGAGLPEAQQVYETGVLLRRHNTDRIVAFDQQWWSELESGSRRDQISFAYLCWRTDLAVREFAPPGTGVRDHPDFEYREHLVAGRFRPPRNTVDAATDRLNWNLVRRRHEDPHGEPLRSVVADVDVVVPIHDALEHVQRCVRSLESDSQWSGQLFLVDDGSDESTSRWCAQFAEARPQVDLRRHTRARGFAAASNAGLAASSAPYVVVLNSDTVVPGGWLRKMRRVMTSNSSIGLVGPLSNAASWQSIPRIRTHDGALAVNALPAGMSLEEMNTFLEELTRDVITPLVPSLNGFCLMFRRELLDAVGGFDDDGFPRGYGEEVDLALRATGAGYLCAVAADTYVFHAKSQSFGTVQRDELKAAGRTALLERYGSERLNRVAASTRQHPALEFVRGATERLFAAGD